MTPCQDRGLMCGRVSRVAADSEGTVSAQYGQCPITHGSQGRKYTACAGQALSVRSPPPHLPEADLLRDDVRWLARREFLGGSQQRSVASLPQDTLTVFAR